MDKIRLAPRDLINHQGMPIFGHFDNIPHTISDEKFFYKTCMDRPASRFRKYFDFKQFQFVSIVTKSNIIGLAIADIRYLSSSFIYVYDKENNTLIDIKTLRPLWFDRKTSKSPFSGLTEIKKSNLQFHIQDGHWRIKVSHPSIKIDAFLSPIKNSTPLALCTPTGYSGWTYTQKHNTLNIEGQITVAGKLVDLNGALASYDFSSGYMRRETSWQWANINGRNDSCTLGLNISSGVNETGTTENTLWVNGHKHAVSPVMFRINREKPDDAWAISSLQGDINLTFKPHKKRSEKINLWLLKSNFRQFIGQFDGFIFDQQGQKHCIDGVWGLTEDHYAKW